jgi:hypothetical protein
MDRTKDISPRPDEVTVGGCWNSNAVIALQRANERATVYLHADNLWNSNYNEYVGFLAPGMSTPGVSSRLSNGSAVRGDAYERPA